MVNLTELKAALKPADPTDTAEDQYLLQCEAAAVAYLERETGRSFASATRTEYFEGTGQRELWLAEEPVGTVTVTSDGVAVDAALFTVRGRRLRHGTGWGAAWWAEPADLVATYTGGYQEGAEPADARQVVILLVGAFMENREAVTDAALVEVPLGARDLIQGLRRLTV
jgi:hypothetical protein